ncbi:hypothetical protein BKA66DRAFT_465091 [Pyrenochaeta sp. MPI-SDFR-AT-0127]|nr:hypothetical protein BKA66DRAFT_465091 [Pyrenochaeta sp. MPI-SDFR-AT-0127]
MCTPTSTRCLRHTARYLRQVCIIRRRSMSEVLPRCPVCSVTLVTKMLGQFATKQHPPQTSIESADAVFRCQETPRCSMWLVSPKACPLMNIPLGAEGTQMP